MKKDLFTFLVSKEVPSEHFSAMVKKDIQLSFRKNVIIGKFVGYQLLGTIFSLTFCPQFGVGINPAVNIALYFDQFGMWACAMFCGSLFLSTGAFVAFLGMKGEELWWVWRRYKWALILMPALLWSALMLTNVSMKLPHEHTDFHLFWLVAAMLSVFALFGGRSRFYSEFQSH
jgi:hypothetical protein